MAGAAMGDWMFFVAAENHDVVLGTALHTGDFERAKDAVKAMRITQRPMSERALLRLAEAANDPGRVLGLREMLRDAPDIHKMRVMTMMDISDPLLFHVAAVCTDGSRHYDRLMWLLMEAAIGLPESRRYVVPPLFSLITKAAPRVFLLLVQTSVWMRPTERVPWSDVLARAAAHFGEQTMALMLDGHGLKMPVWPEERGEANSVVYLAVVRLLVDLGAGLGVLFDGICERIRGEYMQHHLRGVEFFIALWHIAPHEAGSSRMTGQSPLAMATENPGVLRSIYLGRLHPQAEMDSHINFFRDLCMFPLLAAVNSGSNRIILIVLEKMLGPVEFSLFVATLERVQMGDTDKHKLRHTLIKRMLGTVLRDHYDRPIDLSEAPEWPARVGRASWLRKRARGQAAAQYLATRHLPAPPLGLDLQAERDGFIERALGNYVDRQDLRSVAYPAYRAPPRPG